LGEGARSRTSSDSGAASTPFPMSRFVLYSSRASVGGGPYVVEAEYPLAA
jgi:RNA 2',3'-cyclic 3'-phosphodiesterase